MQPETVVLPLRLDVEVYSGIAPPPQLLKAMSGARDAGRPTPKTNRATSANGRPPVARPVSLGKLPSGASAGSPRPGSSGKTIFSQPLPEYFQAPPSYEDAIAADMRPVDAPRPNYAPPPAGEDNILRGDEKN